jgi:Ulp1 protease family, C-terminal catalytic domain
MIESKDYLRGSPYSQKRKRDFNFYDTYQPYLPEEHSPMRDGFVRQRRENQLARYEGALLAFQMEYSFKEDETGNERVRRRVHHLRKQAHRNFLLSELEKKETEFKYYRVPAWDIRNNLKDLGFEPPEFKEKLSPAIPKRRRITKAKVDDEGVQEAIDESIVMNDAPPDAPPAKCVDFRQPSVITGKLHVEKAYIPGLMINENEPGFREYRDPEPDYDVDDSFALFPTESPPKPSEKYSQKELEPDANGCTVTKDRTFEDMFTSLLTAIGYQPNSPNMTRLDENGPAQIETDEKVEKPIGKNFLEEFIESKRSELDPWTQKNNDEAEARREDEAKTKEEADDIYQKWKVFEKELENDPEMRARFLGEGISYRKDSTLTLKRLMADGFIEEVAGATQGNHRQDTAGKPKESAEHQQDTADKPDGSAGKYRSPDSEKGNDTSSDEKPSSDEPDSGSSSQRSRSSSPFEGGLIDEAQRLALQPRLIKPLSADASARLNKVMSVTDHTEQLTPGPGTRLTRRDLGMILPQAGTGDDPSAWLNDDVVNVFCTKLCETMHAKKKHYVVGKKDVKKPYLYHAFSSHWFGRICEAGPTAVHSWGRKAGLIGKPILNARKIFVPICKGAHWTLGVIYPSERKLEYLDSFGNNGKEFFQIARQWLAHELKESKTYNANEWTEVTGRSGLQNNMSDCGVFTAFNAFAVAQDFKPSEVVRAEDMPMARRQLAATLINGGFTNEFDF